MKTGIFLSYKGLGANLLHLSYCHQIAKKFGPVSIITLCPNLDKILKDDPLIKEVLYLNKYHNLIFFLKNLQKKIEKFDLLFHPSYKRNYIF